MSRLFGAILFLFLMLSQVPLLSVSGAIPSSEMSYIREDTSGIRIGNDLIEIYLNKSLSVKGLPITCIANKMNGWDYQLTNVTQHIFSLRFRDHQGNHLWMGPAGFRAMAKNTIRIDNGSTLHLSWITNDQFGPKNICIHVSITIYDDSPLTRWSIGIENNEDLALYEVIFPIIDGLTKLGESEKDLVVIHPGMYAEGSWLIRNPISIFANSTHYDQGGAGGLYPTWMPVQFLSCYDEKGAGGIYLATDDTEGYFKSFEMFMNPGTSQLISWIKHYPAIAFGTGYEPSYSVLLGVYKGSSWQASADIYKSWALKQWWAQQRLGDKEAPGWFNSLAGAFLGATYSGSRFKIVNFSELASSARALNNSLHLFEASRKLPLLIIIAGWEANGALRFYPDVFPPVEGDLALKGFVDQVHSYGMKAGAFFLASCAEFTPGGPSMLMEGYKYLALDEDGNKYVGVFGAAGQEVPSISWATTDVSSDFWRDALINIGTKLVKDYDFDLLCMDTFPTQCVSYNPNANHAPGGGNYAFTSWLDVIFGIRNATKSCKPDLAILVEGLPEIFMPYVNGAYMGDSQWEIFPLHEWGKAGEAIPLFSYIYHDCCLLTGGFLVIRSAPFASLEFPEEGLIKDRMHYNDRYWFSVLSRDFVCGKIPILGQTGLSEEFFKKVMSPEKLQFFEKIAFARYSYARDFLVYGSQLVSFSKLVPTYDLTVDNWGVCRGIKNSGKITLQSIESGIWRSTDGRIAYFFSNAWNRPVNFTFLINFTELGLKTGNRYLAYTIIDGIYTESHVVIDSTVINITLDPQQIAIVMVIEDVPGNSERFMTMMAKSAITIAESQILRAASMNRTVGLADAQQMLDLAEESCAVHNFTEAISRATLAKFMGERTSWPGLFVTVPLKLRVTTTAHWSSILFENAKILRVVQTPIFFSGKGNAYVSSEGPILTGMRPHTVAFEEKFGYQVVYDTSIAPRGIPEIFELILVLCIEPHEKALRIQIGKESWDNYQTSLELFNNINGDILLNHTQLHGWSDIKTIEIDKILPKYELNVVSDYSLVEGSGQYTINTTASFSLKSALIDCYNGTRRVFLGWEGDYQGKMPSVSIIMDSPKNVTAKWETKYYLKIISEHESVLGEGWYSEGSEAKLTAMSETIGFPLNWIFIGWSGDLKSESPNASILMDGPKTVIANWEADYTLLPPVMVSVIIVAIIIAIMARRIRTR